MKFQNNKEEDRMNNLLQWIQEWYSSNCDGCWENLYGVKIENIDNPGWSVTIDLIDTELEDRNFTGVELDNSDNDWLCCEVKNGQFVAAGDSRKLEKILTIFKEWCLISRR